MYEHVSEIVSLQKFYKYAVGNSGRKSYHDYFEEQIYISEGENTSFQLFYYFISSRALPS